MRTEHIVLIIIVIVAVVAFINFSPRFLEHYKDQEQAFYDAIEGISIAHIDLEAIPDGVYVGSHDAVWISAEVEIEVVDHRITRIDLIKHMHGRGDAAEQVIDEVLEAQSLAVDTVSGATASSKVILKAIQQALTDGLSEDLRS